MCSQSVELSSRGSNVTNQELPIFILSPNSGEAVGVALRNDWLASAAVAADLRTERPLFPLK